MERDAPRVFALAAGGMGVLLALLAVHLRIAIVAGGPVAVPDVPAYLGIAQWVGGDGLAKMGASPVSLPGAQIYENLVSGAIDGTEWAGPLMDSIMKFWEVAKYYYYPGLHEPGTIVGFGVNKAWYDGLPKSDQLLIEACCVQTHFDLFSEVNAKNPGLLQQFITEQGVQLKKFNEDIVDAFGEAAEEVFEETRQHSELARRIDDSFRTSMRDVASWLSIAEIEYFKQRNRVLGIGI